MKSPSRTPVGMKKSFDPELSKTGRLSLTSVTRTVTVAVPVSGWNSDESRATTRKTWRSIDSRSSSFRVEIKPEDSWMLKKSVPSTEYLKQTKPKNSLGACVINVYGSVISEKREARRYLETYLIKVLRFVSYGLMLKWILGLKNLLQVAVIDVPVKVFDKGPSVA